MRSKQLRAVAQSLESSTMSADFEEISETRESESGEVVESDALARAVDELLPLVQRECDRRLPWTTYRVQLNSRCPFRTVELAVPYLAKLGVSDLYASPFLQARPGSVHGYDIVDHHQINNEIGSRDELQSLSAALKAHELGLVADLVPNHMCASPVLNAWWQDVLENGPCSIYASYFDIDWMPLKPDLAHKVLLPVLGDQFGKVLEDGHLTVSYSDGSFWLTYFEHRFPVSPRSYALILSPNLEALEEQVGDNSPVLLELLSILTAIRNLPDRTETAPEKLIERRREKEVIKRRLNELTQSSPQVLQHIEANLHELNGQAGHSKSFEGLDELLNAQAYRLSYWRTATDEINYRRFFDINELAAIRTESNEVFAQTHQLILELLDDNTITGLRIDHPDGLYDPQGYLYHLQEQFYQQRCRQLINRRRSLSEAPTEVTDEEIESRLVELWRSATQIPGSPLSRPLYIVAEKILASEETIPHDWPIHGTVGYEFLNCVNGLFVNAAEERAITNTFARFTGESQKFEELAYRCKRLIVRMSMASEINVLGHQLDRISERNRWTRDFTLSSQTRALQEVVAAFQIYRTYVRAGHVQERDRLYIEAAVALAKRRNAAMNASVFDFVQDVLLLKYYENADDEERAAVEQFVGKFQQVTGPIMAKAVEDTAFYRFNRLISLNEVGGEPSDFGNSVDDFHRFNLARLPWQAFAMNATSTHDTKRSEDVRARINVISEIPKDWRTHLQRWGRAHRKYKTAFNGVDAPDANIEYLLYQTLIGIWPETIPEGESLDTFVDRVQQYMLKVAREAKLHTSWISPVESYETAVSEFVNRLLKNGKRRPFLDELNQLANKIAEHGRWNSLSQLVLKLASPGVADFYQGSEVWNLTLVDPDNRQPVNYAQLDQQLDDIMDQMRAALAISATDDVISTWLSRLQSPLLSSSTTAVNELLIHDLMENRRDGRIKQFVTLMGMQLRRSAGNLFTTGVYLPLNVTGELADCVIAFAREDLTGRSIVVVPRLTVRICGFGGPPPLGNLWKDTAVELPPGWKARTLTNVFTLAPAARDDSIENNSSLLVSEILQTIPVAWLVGPAKPRSQAAHPAIASHQ